MPNNPSPVSLKKLPVKLICLLGAVLLILAGVGIYLYQANQAKQHAVHYKTAAVHRGQIKVSVTATGIVAAYREIEIKAKSSGKITKLPFDVSDPVKKGDLLVELDPIDQLPAAQEAQANLLAAQAKLTQSVYNLQVAERTVKTDEAHDVADIQSTHAKSKYAVTNQSRLDQLLKNQYISQDEYDTAVTNTISTSSDLRNAQIKLTELETEKLALNARRDDVRIARDQLAAAQYTWQDAAQHVKDTKLYSPIDGVVSALNVQIGQIMASGITNVGGGTSALSVADISRMYILASVDESDIANVRVGQPVNITADSYPGKMFYGRVDRIATEGVNASNVVTFQVKVEVTSRNKYLLKPQMTTNVEIVEAERDNTLIVPKDAVMQGQRHPNPHVQVLNTDQTITVKPVEVGLNNDTDQEILSGLNEGETVIVHSHELQSKWKKPQQPTGAMNGPAGMMMGGGHGH